MGLDPETTGLKPQHSYQKTYPAALPNSHLLVHFFNHYRLVTFAPQFLLKYSKVGFLQGRCRITPGITPLFRCKQCKPGYSSSRITQSGCKLQSGSCKVVFVILAVFWREGVKIVSMTDGSFFLLGRPEGQTLLSLEHMLSR
jgi:hypothetical protein